MGSKFVAGLVRETIILYMFSLNITDRFLCKADFILSKKIPHDISNFFSFYIAGLYRHKALLWCGEGYMEREENINFAGPGKCISVHVERQLNEF